MWVDQHRPLDTYGIELKGMGWGWEPWDSRRVGFCSIYSSVEYVTFRVLNLGILYKIVGGEWELQVTIRDMGGCTVTVECRLTRHYQSTKTSSQNLASTCDKAREWVLVSLRVVAL